MKKYTPTPWVLTGDINSVGGIDLRGDTDSKIWIASINNDHHTQGDRPSEGFPGNIEGQANANLIVAAPEMLEFLETLESDKNRIPTWLWESIQELLRKIRNKD